MACLWLPYLFTTHPRSYRLYHVLIVRVFNSNCSSRVSAGIALFATGRGKWSCLKVVSHVSEIRVRRLNRNHSIVKFGVHCRKFVLVMELDKSVIRALEIFDATAELDDGIGVGTCQSLYQLLNKCRSNPGKRLLRSWLEAPLTDEVKIKERLDVVEALFNEHSCRNILHDDLLRIMPDIPELAKRATQKQFTLNDCYRLYQVVMALEHFDTALTELFEEQTHCQASIKALTLDPVRFSRHEFKKFAALVDQMIDLKHYEETGDFRITPSSDPKLNEMNVHMERIKKRCDKALSEVQAELSNDTIKLDCHSQHGYYFRVTLKEERTIRQAKKIRILDSTKGVGVRFSTRKLDALNDENVELIKEYEESQEVLKKMVLEVACGYLPAFEALSEAVSIIDVLVSFAMVASTSSSSYTRPKILSLSEEKESHKTKYISLKGCRHPMIEKSEGVHFIPNDLVPRKDRDDSFVIVTGANMGGKSTYLRSVAITVLLAQIGSFVPCEEAEFAPFDGIYTRIGAGDYQCEGVSTFMAEMMDCSAILNSATESSLVIIDELGRGTSTFDGFGLAWAIAEYIIEKKGCFTLFATHFHEVTELEKKHQRVRNMHVETHIDESGMVHLLYKIVDGVVDRSFGMHVAKSVDFPVEILKDAADILNKIQGEGEQGEVKEVVNSLRELAFQSGQMNEDELRRKILEIVPDNL
ncbi:hypothetical protein L596_004381 [Steinernema carpocapsae]|uniref:DNA mismatch repair proteins mutS family domain-containing protein n=1 Tax=Steinernema carpocapsae TaxID=34508 RepID=A0A4U8UVM4_STECR|nr:hypothetical protein L596_004381 [Steinernema carpocapsae]